MSSIEKKIPPLVVVIIFAMIMWLVAKIPPTVVYITTDFMVVNYLAVGLLCLFGVLLLMAGAVVFRGAETTMNPLRPELASTLVTSGIYSVTRNPMYLGFGFILLAWCVYLASLWSMSLLVGYIFYIQRFQIQPEESALALLFGEEFILYKKRVRRWL
jgi:protein-S-isoprenylcysteine O-methyltransferase Ste14